MLVALNLIAWPIAWWLMRRWLAGFAYQVQLGAWTFLGASAAAVLIAWATVAAQALVAARTRPAAALRYEKRKRGAPPMFRNYLAAAFRNFARNEVYAGLTVAGLAIGFAAAILIALFVRDELTWDHFVPGYKDIYQVTITVRTTMLAPEEASMLNAWTGQLLQARFPEARVARASPPYAGRTSVGTARFGRPRATSGG